MSECLLLVGCGDLGLRLAALLVARGDEVFALRRHPPKTLIPGIHWLQGDLARCDGLPALPSAITQLVYLPAPDARDEASYRAVFINGLRHLFTALDLGHLRRSVLVSSSAVYGEHGGAWVNEDTHEAPLGFNGRLLLEAERVLNQQLRGTSAACVVLRLAGLYGPGRIHLIQRLRTQQVTVVRDPPHWSNLIHIDDAAAAIAHLLCIPYPETLYLGVDDTPLPLHERYDHLAALLKLAPALAGASPVNVGSKRLCNARLRASGFTLQWPDARAGYAALLAAGQEEVNRNQGRIPCGFTGI